MLSSIIHYLQLIQVWKDAIQRIYECLLSSIVGAVVSSEYNAHFADLSNSCRLG